MTGLEETSDELGECRLDEDEDACVADSGVLNMSGERSLSVASLSSKSLQSLDLVISLRVQSSNCDIGLKGILRTQDTKHELKVL